MDSWAACLRIEEPGRAFLGRWGARGWANTYVRTAARVVEILGDVAEIEVEISGMLPGPEGLKLVSRTEQWFSSRLSTSTAALEAGDPPTGYRFRVTPRF